MSLGAQRRQIAAIQGLRGVAALMVVVAHLQDQMSRNGWMSYYGDALEAGADIFFVISGFIMWLTTAERPERTAGQFVAARIARVVPLYWLMTSLMLAILIVAPAAMGSTRFDLGHVIASYLFFPVQHPVIDDYFPLLIPGWTLNYEMFFYLLFALAMLASGTSLTLRGGLLLATLAGLVAAGAVLPLDGAAWFYTRPVILEFGAGMLLAMAYRSGRVPASPLWWLLSLASFVLILAMIGRPVEGDRALIWGIPALLMVAGAAFGTPIRARAIELLGDWSYSLYLSHPIVLAVAYKLWSKATGESLPFVYPLFALACTFVTAAIMYRVVEAPLTRVARRRLQPSSPTTPITEAA